MIFTVAIDGPAAAGKGTISKAVATRFCFRHLDTGLLYRAVGARTLRGEDAVAAAHTLTPEDMTSDTLRTAAVAEAASRVAILPNVRAALAAYQREVARADGGAVLDGRDIGTVICPDAEVKLFVIASAEVRAARRFAELAVADPDITLAAVLADVRARDDRDMNRAEAPLKPALDAFVIDTSEMDIDTAVEAAAARVQAVLDAR